MTPAILPNLLACVPAQGVAVSDTAGPSAGAGIDFSALLLALLPGCTPAAEKPEIPIEPRATNDNAETQGEPAPEDPPADQRSQEPDPAAAPVISFGAPVPIVPGAPLPALPPPGDSGNAPDRAGEVRATEATEPVEAPPAPAAGRQARDQGPQAEPVAAPMPLPSGFETEAAESVFAIQPEVESRAAVEEVPAPADRKASAAGAGPALSAPKQGPRNAEMAFAARLTAPPEPSALPAATRAPELHIAMPAEMHPAGDETERGPAAPAAARAPELHVATPPEMRPVGPEAKRGPAAPSRAGALVAAAPQPDLNQGAQGGPAPAKSNSESVPVQEPGLAPEPAADVPPPIEQAEARARQAPVPRAQARTDDDPVPQAQAPAAADVKSRAAGSGGGTASEPRPDRPGTGPRGTAGGEGPAAPVMHRSESAAAPVPRQTVPRERAAAAPAAGEVIEVQPGRPEQARPQALRELSVVLPGRPTEGGKAEPQVEIRVVERTGDVRVAVRTADSRLTSSLREDLPQLVSQLADRGYRAETWHPTAAAPAGEGRPMRAESSEPGRDGGNSGSPGRGGSDTGGRGGNGGRREQGQNQPEWLDALERSLGPDSAPIRSIL